MVDPAQNLGIGQVLVGYGERSEPHRSGTEGESRVPRDGSPWLQHYGFSHLSFRPLIPPSNCMGFRLLHEFCDIVYEAAIE